MSTGIRTLRGMSLFVGLALAASIASPASAQANFFEQLFGGGASQAPQPMPNYDPAPSIDPTQPVLRAAPRHVKRIVRDIPPVRQKTTDLWHDKTLRPGDAIMMKSGIHIYNGPEAGRHNAGQFVPVDEARHVPKSERAELVAMDTTHSDPFARGTAPDTLASGRSAAVANPVTRGFRITDARGKSMRYVGP